jgi:hypothetical protein
VQMIGVHADDIFERLENCCFAITKRCQILEQYF